MLTTPIRPSQPNPHNEGHIKTYTANIISVAQTNVTTSRSPTPSNDDDVLPSISPTIASSSKQKKSSNLDDTAPIMIPESTCADITSLTRMFSKELLATLTSQSITNKQVENSSNKGAVDALLRSSQDPHPGSRNQRKVGTSNMLKATPENHPVEGEDLKEMEEVKR